MIEGMNPGILTLILFGGMFLVMLSGTHIAFGLGGFAVLYLFLLWGPPGLILAVQNAWSSMTNFVLVCIPLFIFMGIMLQESGVADGLYTMFQKWAGGLRGGLGAGTVGICMIFAAMTGMSGTATVTMGTVALPEMLKRNYHKNIALGSIVAGGALGILIPPSVTMVFWALVTKQSVGQLFVGGIIPGILLGSLFIIYILVRCGLQPHLGPAPPPEERGSWRDKLVSLKGVILPIFVILAVMGTIFAGIATPTEAAAMGALATIISAAVNRRLNWAVIKSAAHRTVSVTAMALWLYFAAVTLICVYFSIGAPTYIGELLAHVPGGKWGVLIAIQVIWLFMGMFIDPIGICLYTGPIFAPIMAALGFDLVWFGIVFIINMEMAYLTPPFGFNLFYLKGVAPKDVTLTDIYKSVWPFVLLQMTVLAIVIIFPQLILWLPSLMIK